MVASLPTTELSVSASILPIETVTVHQPSGAQVIRRLDVDLKAGTNVIEVTNLSSVADTESFRVDGLGSARLLVVQCVLDRYPEIPRSDAIRDLKSQLDQLQMERKSREDEVGILKAFGKSMAGRHDLTHGEVTTFSDTLFSKTLACAETTRELSEKITRLQQKLNKLQSSKSGEASTKAVITILAAEDGLAQLRLIYRVLDAYWHPLYDLYTTSEDGKPSTSVSLHYRVNLQQYTGEDWNNAKLILSTSATDVLNAGIPKQDNLVIEPPPIPDVVLQAYQGASPCLLSMDAELEDAESDEDMGFIFCEDEPVAEVAVAPAPLPKLVQSAAAVSKSPMAISYAVDALTTVPSDGISHKVLVAVIPLEAVITHIITPRKSPVAYLQCAVENTSDYFLLPGTMSVFLNDSFVSKTDISDIATGDTFKCTLGMDTSIRVSHELTESSITSAPSSFLEQYMTTTYISTTKLHNRHTGDYPVNVVERSSIPVAWDYKHIKVFLKGPEGLAEGEEGQEVDLGRKDGFKVKWGRDVEDTRNGQKEGKFIWYGTIPPGEGVVLISKWDVRAPVDAGWRLRSE